jgi:DNA polymerase-1
VAGDAGRPKVGHDAKAAVVAFSRLGIPVRGVVGDTALASHLKEPSGWAPHEIDQVARIVLRRPVRDDVALRGKGSARMDWADLPVANTGDLAGHLAETSGELWRALARETPPALLEEHLALCETLVRMERNGMPVDGDDLEWAGVDFDAIGVELERQIHALARKEFNVNSTPQLGGVLFEDLKLPVVARTKTGWSVATEALERVAQAHPIVPLVIRFRLLKRMRDSWVTALRAAIDPDGRVRATFHPARSFTGRLVVSQPDLGRVPGRTPEMARIRRAFRAPPGWTLLSVDFVQLGLHLSRDPALVEPLRRREDVHRLTASAVLEVPPDAITYDRRQIGKVINFATFAGQGERARAPARRGRGGGEGPDRPVRRAVRGRAGLPGRAAAARARARLGRDDRGAALADRRPAGARPDGSVRRRADGPPWVDRGVRRGCLTSQLVARGSGASRCQERADPLGTRWDIGPSGCGTSLPALERACLSTIAGRRTGRA